MQLARALLVASLFGLGIAWIAYWNTSPDASVAQRSGAEDPITVANVARDGLFPTPTPTPPPPDVAGDCYQPRPADTSPFVLLPAGTDSIFQSCQIVAYYGYPRVPALGVLGEFTDLEEMARQLESTAAAYDAVNGPRSVLPALHIIAAAAQGSPGADGDYTARIPTSLIDEFIGVAERHGFVVFLDLQIGWSTVEAEVEHLKPYLRNPYVHLALDPEWALPVGIPPGTKIGSLDAADINYAQSVLQEIVHETGLPPRVLIVHQFTESMITHKEQLTNYPGVELVIDMDGFGGREIKVAHYQRFVVDDAAEHGGMKLFIDEDVNIFSPAEVSALQPQPDYIQYQ